MGDRLEAALSSLGVGREETCAGARKPPPPPPP